MRCPNALKGPFSSYLWRLWAIIMTWQKIAEERMVEKLSKEKPGGLKHYQRARRIQS